MNWYSYVRSNPTNNRDSTGKCRYDNYSMHVYDARGNDLGTDLVHVERWSVAVDCDAFSEPTSFREGNVGTGGYSQTEQDCTNGATHMTITRLPSGRTSVAITTKVQITGPGAPTSGQYLDMISDRWSGTKGAFDVTNTFVQGSGLRINVTGSSTMSGGISHSWIGSTLMEVPNLLGNSPAQLEVNGNVAAHEYGHPLGLPDRYHDGRPDPGYVGTIMGDGFNSPVTGKTISEAIETCKAP